jgi:hypothetical protein
MAVPNTTTFAMSDVVTEVGSGTGLINLMRNAAGYDPTYYNNPTLRNSLLSFRNYTQLTAIHETGTATANNSVAATTDTYYRGQTFELPQAVTAADLHVQVAIAVTGAPNGDSTLKITGVSGSEPDYTNIIGTATWATSNLGDWNDSTGSLGWSYDLHFTFSSITLAADTLYAIVYIQDNATNIDGSNYSNPSNFGTNVYPLGGSWGSANSGSTWPTGPNNDLKVRFLID